jgi:hypothetical protein
LSVSLCVFRDAAHKGERAASTTSTDGVWLRGGGAVYLET